MTKRPEIKTQQGYNLFEVASAFQKSVRRGLEDEAMYWAVELFNSNYDEYLWKRLKIITSEDVGLAVHHLPATVYALYQNYVDQKKKKDEKHRPERLFLTHAVLLVCRAKKSRVVDHALMHFWNTHYANKKPIPEFAHDKHTQAGRSAGYGWNHFFEEGAKLQNIGAVEGEQYYKKLARQSVENPSTYQEPPEFKQGGIFEDPV
jgi:replication-associated recombination protein RarA